MQKGTCIEHPHESCTIRTARDCVRRSLLCAYFSWMGLLFIACESFPPLRCVPTMLY
ncbi:hypothetical protein ASPBRDRAFT_45863 [Aspergillus brasiliensis CBS 101740]|uniref:Uncharacterized protein n=1 Tax=Aspergillus brasiliensis (strain CBS 101740 / IMI 381727 / IBT 21946) TaxID=767769 RepID=A0A1L9UCW7_ASPBC|nr:hypothetical protein ASPBRDRAFT_45863 [Aspergillus brasiliensis CBS 101740]